ncbi:holo-ACP synthase [Alicyclobacillus sp. ALC3]|uniref:holo-ACP synthase n=1 Tax=Alicyclobacillus sp. ALC3 TaxID=2796143 RepID=UPI002377E970|nr:holo-ACP synthase [Alicyclobacillus sp. ALC3]WDL95446.1 holo-ACP synthase [Alicyclobacillus sp. ALC3]
MIRGLGTDVVEVARVEELWRRQGDKLLTRVLAPLELASIHQLPQRRQAEYLAGRFAAKEAIAKALGRGLGHLHMARVAVTPNEWGRPTVVWTPHGQADTEWLEAAAGVWHVSISHTAEVALAAAVWEQPEGSSGLAGLY